MVLRDTFTALLSCLFALRMIFLWDLIFLWRRLINLPPFLAVWQRFFNFLMTLFCFLTNLCTLFTACLLCFFMILQTAFLSLLIFFTKRLLTLLACPPVFLEIVFKRLTYLFTTLVCFLNATLCTLLHLLTCLTTLDLCTLETEWLLEEDLLELDLLEDPPDLLASIPLEKQKRTTNKLKSKIIFICILKSVFLETNLYKAIFFFIILLFYLFSKKKKKNSFF